MQRTWGVRLLVLILFSTLTAHSQITEQGHQQEQSSFASEEAPGTQRIKHPVQVPDAAIEVLKTDDTVKSCLEDNPLAPGQDIGSWFVASKIHLGSAGDTDIIVLPSLHGEESKCFESIAGIGLYWIVRSTGKQYQLVLTTWGGSLQILAARNNGFRDIQTETLGQAGRYLTTVTFRFDGNRYEKYRETTQKR